MKKKIPELKRFGKFLYSHCKNEEVCSWRNTKIKGYPRCYKPSQQKQEEWAPKWFREPQGCQSWPRCSVHGPGSETASPLPSAEPWVLLPAGQCVWGCSPEHGTKEHYSRALQSSGTWLANFWTFLRLISPSFPFERGMSILYTFHHCILEQNNLFHKFTAGDKFCLRMNWISPISDLDVKMRLWTSDVGVDAWNDLRLWDLLRWN